MLRNCLFALVGTYSLQLCNRLPSDTMLVAAIALAAGGLCFRRVRPAGFFLLGLCLVWISSRAVIHDRLSPELAAETLTVVGRIADFPDARAGPLRLVLSTDDRAEWPARIRLSWYDAPALPRIGETWTLQVRLRRPRGFSNPVRFDYEHWLFRQRITATGYVVNGTANARNTDISVDRVSALRQHMVDRMTALLGHNDATAVLQAVTVGATHEISKQQWERYAATGTSHIMAISGMNIAMAAGGAFVLAWLGLAACCRSANIRDAALAIAAVVAILYAEISGFAVPARRAMLMACMVMAANLMRRQLFAKRLLAVSCMFILFTEPLAAHAPGFQLSFAAVAILLWVARQRGLATRHPDASVTRRVARGTCELTVLQFTLLLGLFPLTAVLFGRVAWFAPLVNMMALPVFDLVTVPTGLLGLLLDGPLEIPGDWLLWIAWHSVRLLLGLIAIVAEWPLAHTHIAAISGATLIVAWLPAVWAIAPPGFPGRRLAWIAALALVLQKPPPPPQGCLGMTVLDVGQGLSIELETHRRTLVYDTGPAFQSGSDTGALVVVPYLRALGARRVDTLIVSHADLDHAGGVASLLETYPVSQIFTGERLPKVRRRQLHCRSGQAWLWDGVRFAFMNPRDYALATGNNASCVLEIAVGSHRILLTGDIELPLENHLLRTMALTAVDVVIVPHHGSRTSSSLPFVNRLRPRIAIVSAGYDNRWGFPKADIVARWQAAGANVLNTATSGAISLQICPGPAPIAVNEHRIRHHRYWTEP
ncbi:MAG: DNA internalization-related competence protein ComEC/Rec2 [Woeseiaceae bacterium]